MKRIIFYWLVILAGCHSPEKGADNSGKDKTVKTDTGDSLVKKNQNADSSYLLRYKNDSVSQTMTIKYLAGKKIEFTLTTINTKLDKKNVLNGFATMDDPEGDPEEDQSEGGVAFLYDNWHYVNGKCQLNFRMAKQAEYVRIFEFDCNNIQDKSCPFAAGGVLKRIDIEE